MTFPLVSFCRNAFQDQKLSNDENVLEWGRKLYTDDMIITFEEARELFRFYHQNIPKICDLFDIPINTQLQAHLLLSKYFHKHSALEYNLKHVMLACCFLAAKLDNFRLSLDTLCSKIKNTDRDIISTLEFVLLEVIDYQPWLYTPYYSILGFLLQKGLLNQIDHELLAKHLVSLYETDAPFTYNVKVLSYFVIQKVIPGVDFEGFDFDPKVLAELERILNQPPLDINHIKQIDRKIIEFSKNTTNNQ